MSYFAKLGQRSSVHSKPKVAKCHCLVKTTPVGSNFAYFRSTGNRLRDMINLYFSIETNGKISKIFKKLIKTKFKNLSHKFCEGPLKVVGEINLK